ncbi:MAG: ATP-dependent protease subunit HslV [Brevinematia bacterium]
MLYYSYINEFYGEKMSNNLWHSTTIVCVRKADEVVIAGDGQVTLGDTIVKNNAVKIRKLYKNTILSGFSGSAADSFALLERFELKLEEFSGDLLRASVGLAKEWRLDKALRQLEAMLIVADKERTFVISGDGNLLEPEDPVVSIGSGAGYAKAAALAFLESSPSMKAKDIAVKSLEIASKICIYTNSNITVETL